MLALAIVTICAGIATIIEMIIWCVDTWKQATKEEKEIMRIQKFNKMMRDIDLKSWN